MEQGDNRVPENKQEILVIGNGEAGKYLAWTLAKAGSRAAVVERKLIGGSCPNITCLPSKNMIHSAKVAALARRGAEFGLETGLWCGILSAPIRLVKDIPNLQRSLSDSLNVRATYFHCLW